MRAGIVPAMHAADAPTHLGRLQPVSALPLSFPPHTGEDLARAVRPISCLNACIMIWSGAAFVYTALTERFLRPCDNDNDVIPV